VGDARKRPIIAQATALWSVLEMVALGQRSLLEVDQYARMPGARAWHGSRRPMVLSDTSLERIVEGACREDLRGIPYRMVCALERRKALEVKLPSGRRVRVGLADGTDFGGMLACVFSFAAAVDAPVDMQAHTRGKELAACRDLLCRVRRRRGPSFADLVVFDGLYLTGPHLRLCKEQLGCEAVVKTKERRLSLIADAEGLFSLPAGEAPGIERVEGVDAARGVRYWVTAAGGFRWNDVPFALKVARVQQEKLKPAPGEEPFETFWVVATDESLSALDLRELGHMRWRIENNVFKRLSELVGSKRGFIRNKKVKEALLLIWFIGLLALGYYLLCRSAEKVSQALGGARRTWRILNRLFWIPVAQECAVKV